MRETALVFGGTGFLGARIADSLAARDVEVVTIARRSAHLTVDVTDAGAMRRLAEEDAVRRATTIVCCLGAANVAGSLSSCAAHIRGVEHVTRLASSLDALQRTVLVSSMLVYGNASPGSDLGSLHLGQRLPSPYAYAKYVSEQSFSAAGLRGAVVRPGLVLGDPGSGGVPRGQPIWDLLDLLLTLPIIPAAHGGRFPLWTAPVGMVADDVARAAIDGDHDVVVSADPSSLDLRDLVQHLLEPFAKRTPVVDIGEGRLAPFVLRPVLRRLGVSAHWLQYATPWARVERDVLREHRRGMAAAEPGYVGATASHVRDAMTGRSSGA